MHQPSPLYKRHRFPGEIISHAVWLYYRFLLSDRDVEELLAERGIAVGYETIRRQCRKVGQTFAGGVRRRRARPGGKWHLDEVQLKINGRKHWTRSRVEPAAQLLERRARPNQGGRRLTVGDRSSGDRAALEQHAADAAERRDRVPRRGARQAPQAAWANR